MCVLQCLLHTILQLSRLYGDEGSIKAALYFASHAVETAERADAIPHKLNGLLLRGELLLLSGQIPEALQDIESAQQLSTHAHELGPVMTKHLHADLLARLSKLEEAELSYSTSQEQIDQIEEIYRGLERSVCPIEISASLPLPIERQLLRQGCLVQVHFPSMI